MGILRFKAGIILALFAIAQAGGGFGAKLDSALSEAGRPAHGWVIGKVAQASHPAGEWDLTDEDMGFDKQAPQPARKPAPEPRRPRQMERPDTQRQLEELRHELEQVNAENRAHMETLLEIVRQQGIMSREGQGRLTKIIEGLTALAGAIGGLFGIIKGVKAINKRRPAPEKTLW